MAKFIVIGERIHCISPTIRQAMETMTCCLISLLCST